MTRATKKFLAAAFSCLVLSGGLPAASASEEIPLYYPLQPLSVQYETKNCGSTTVVIRTQLEFYGGQSKNERITAYMPKIMSMLYGNTRSYLRQKQGHSAREVKELFHKTANKVLGQGFIHDVLIMNITTNN